MHDTFAFLSLTAVLLSEFTVTYSSVCTSIGVPLMSKVTLVIKV